MTKTGETKISFINYTNNVKECITNVGIFDQMKKRINSLQHPNSIILYIILCINERFFFLYCDLLCIYIYRISQPSLSLKILINNVK